MKYEWLKISNKTQDSVDISLEGFISAIDPEATSSKAFDAMLTPLEKSGVKDANLNINCYGGSCAEGIAINNRIDRSPIRIQKIVTGVAASMGAVVAIGKETIMNPHAKLMLHKPSGGAQGSAKELRDQADVIDGWEDSMVSIIAEKTGQHADLIRMKYFKEGQDVWLSAQEAIDNGLVKGKTQGSTITPPTNWLQMEVAASYKFIQDTTNHNSKPNPIDMDFKEIAAAAGLNDSATKAEIIAALGKMKDLSTANATLTQEKAELTEKLSTAEASLRTAQDSLAKSEDDKVKTLVSSAVSTGKIVAAQVPQYEKLAKADFDSTKSILDAMAPKKDLLAALSKEKSGATGEDQTRANWTYEDWSKKDSKGLAKMRSEDPEKFDSLFNAQYKKA